jgi:hypothetical protein
MIQIPIANIPNQSFSINLDESQYDIRIHATSDRGIPGNEIMAVTIIRDSVIIVSGMRAVSDYPIIPYAYLEDGNFFITTMNDEYPDWRQFGNTQYLIFASQAELIAARTTV